MLTTIAIGPTRPQPPLRRCRIGNRNERRFAYEPHPSPTTAGRGPSRSQPGLRARLHRPYGHDPLYGGAGLARRARPSARAPITVDPASAVLHYAQEIFEGLKAYRLGGRRHGLFRPDTNARRFSRPRGGWRCRNCPRSCSSHRAANCRSPSATGSPPVAGGSLYLRPFMIASEVFLGVQARRATISTWCCRVVGGRLLEGRRACDLAVGQPRLYPRRARRHRCGQMRRQLRDQPGRAGRGDPPRLRPGRVPRRGRAPLGRGTRRHEHLLRVRRRSAA